MTRAEISRKRLGEKARGAMAKTYALRKLLEHGPLTRSELIEITGWTPNSCMRTVQWLREKGRIESIRNCYTLTQRSLEAA